jgi:hypothetical protein
VQAVHAVKLKRILTVLDQASSPTELSQPDLRTHPLKGVRHGF